MRCCSLSAGTIGPAGLCHPERSPLMYPPSLRLSRHHHHRPCTAQRSSGQCEEHPRNRNSPVFRLILKIALPSRDHLAATLNQSTISWSFYSPPTEGFNVIPL